MKDVTVIVDVNGFKTSLTIDPTRFDDPSLEAATRIVEQNRRMPGFSVQPVIRCQEGTHIRNYNTYWVLVNAARYKAAENLRQMVWNRMHFDVAHQPYHGGDLQLDAYA